MSTTLWIVLGALGWLVLSIVVAAPVAQVLSLGKTSSQPPLPRPGADRPPAPALEVAAPPVTKPQRVLVVDDDPGLRQLLRTSFESAHIAVEEADSATSAARRIAEAHPDVVVLDVGMPGVDGLTFCRGLKSDPRTRSIGVVLLTGSDLGTESAAQRAGADALLHKPFSPLALMRVIEDLAEGQAPARQAEPGRAADRQQLMLYAEDLGRVLELERGQRTLLQEAYRETVAAFSRALESKDAGTGAHSQRVQRYATELLDALDPNLAALPGLEYGFLLHDVGKIAIPDHVLGKPGPLSPAERRLIETHTLLGEQMLGDVVLLREDGLDVVRSHHERWDGRGYPHNLSGDNIPLGARVFAIADSLDAMTTDRPYRAAGSWAEATAEIVSQAGRQFDPDVVQAFCDRERTLREIFRELPPDGTPGYTRAASGLSSS